MTEVVLGTWSPMSDSDMARCEKEVHMIGCDQGPFKKYVSLKRHGSFL